MREVAMRSVKGYVATVNGWRLTRDGLGRIVAMRRDVPYYDWRQFSGPDAEQQARDYAANYHKTH